MQRHPNQILLIEDNPDHVELIVDTCQRAFGKDARVTVFDNITEGLVPLYRGDFDVALCDLQLPDSPIESTLVTLKHLRTDIPIVILTSLNDTETGRELVRAGVQDYLPKDELGVALLQRVCEYAIERKQQQLILEGKGRDQQVFCRSLSHDFKSPIRNIGQLSTLLKESLASRIALNDHEMRLFGLIENKINVINELVDGLYQYLRVELVDAKEKEVDLQELVGEVRQFLISQGDSSAEISIGSLPIVVGHRSQLFVLFQNLIGNGIKYNDGTPKIRIESVVISDSVEIIVKDNGIGIDPQHWGSIFQPFKRLHTEEKFSGSGLGLSIVKRIVENHKGKIRVESTIGSGSSFIVSFPRLN